MSMVTFGVRARQICPRVRSLYRTRNHTSTSSSTGGILPIHGSWPGALGGMAQQVIPTGTGASTGGGEPMSTTTLEYHTFPGGGGRGTGRTGATGPGGEQ